MSKIYTTLIKTTETILPKTWLSQNSLWNHPAGPKTVFFWAPVFKWGLVIAGIHDLKRPADQLSLYQAGSLAVTGLIWSRYSMVIIPKNWTLFSVNLFVFMTQSVQFGRAWNHKRLKEKIEN